MSRDQAAPIKLLPEEFSSSRLWHERSPEVSKTACSPTQLQNCDVGLRTRAFQNETSALALGGGIAAGSKTTRNKLPRSPLLTSSMCPPFASTAQRAMARPSPTPPSSLERPESTRYKRSKIRWWCSWAIPGPVSRTSITAWPEDFVLNSTPIVPSFGVYF